jgi:hypothetical protein
MIVRVTPGERDEVSIRTLDRFRAVEAGEQGRTGGDWCGFSLHREA